MATILAIMPNVREAYLEVFRHRVKLMLLLWLPLLMLIALPYMFYIDALSFLSIYYGRLIVAVALPLFMAIPIVAILRLLILKEEPRWNYLRLRRDKFRDPWLTIKFYCRIGRRELCLAALLVSVSFGLMALHQLIGHIIIENLRESNADFNDIPLSHPFHYYRYLISFLGVGLLAGCAWVGSYLAVSERYTWERLRNVLSLMRINFVRSVVIVLLICLPYIILSYGASILFSALSYASFQLNGDAHASIFSAPEWMYVASVFNWSARLCKVFVLVAVACFAANLWKSGLIPQKIAE